MRLTRLTAAASLLFLCVILPARAATMTLDDVISLVRAHVSERIILKQVETTGTQFTLTVDGILALKSAGASDALIESLMGGKDLPEAPLAQADPALAAASSQSIRIYKEVSDGGEEVLHITNLDEQGRRIGGELTESERRTMLSQAAEYRAAEPARESSPGSSYAEGGGRDPVVVNIYNPQQEYQPNVISDEGSYGSGYAHGMYPGLYPVGYYGGGYYGSGNHGGHRGGHFPGCGHSVGVVLPNQFSAGSVGHFNNFHQGFGLVTPLNSTIPQVINVRPYTRGTAHQRNNRNFGRH